MLEGIGRLRQFGFTYDILIYPRQLPARGNWCNAFPASDSLLIIWQSPRFGAEKWVSGPAHARDGRQPQRLLQAFRLITEADWGGWSASQFTPYLDLVFDAFGRGFG